MRHGTLTRRALAKRVLAWGLGLGAAVTGYGVARELRGWGRVTPPPWRLPLERPILGAHRGGRGVFPENTLAAFRGAWEQFGCRLLELDVRASREGVPVVIHDATVDRTTGGTGAVADLTLAELQALDAGHGFRGADGTAWGGRGVRIPTLAALLAALPQAVLSIEVKQRQPPCEAAVAAAIREAGAEGRVLLGAGSHEMFLRIQALAPEIPSFFSFRSGMAFYLAALTGLARWYRPPHHALLVPPRLRSLEVVTARTVAAAHGLGLPVLVWTIDEPAEMARLLALGVDGIITDRPDLLATVVRERAARARQG